MALQYEILTVFNTAFNHMPERERLYVRHKFCDPLLWKFFEGMVEEARLQMIDIDPSGVTPNDAALFLQASQNARLVWQFWHDFMTYVKDWSSQDTTS